MKARLLAVAVLAAIGLPICACTSQSGSAAPQETVTVRGNPTHVVTAGPSGQQPVPAASGAAVASTPGAPLSPAPCLTRYLSAQVGVSQGTASSTYIVLVFKNLNV